MLTIQKLKSASESLKRLEELDKEIIMIEAYAEKVKDKSLTINLNMTYDKPKSDTVSFDRDGSIQIDGVPGHRFFFDFGASLSERIRQGAKPPKEDLNLIISEVTAL